MSTTTPFLTVVITTYDRSDLLEEALRSVISQDFTDYEILIVDDASPDNTEQVAAQLLQSFAQHPAAPPIRYHRLPENRGVDAARTEAILHTRGQFIVYLDDDDRLAPHFLRHASAALQSAPATVGFAVSGRQVIHRTAQSDTLLKTYNYGFATATCLPGDRFLQKTISGASGLIVRPSVVVAAGGWPSGFKSGGDSDLMVRMAGLGDFMVIPEAVLIVYNLERGQITQNIVNRGISHERLIDRNAALFRRFPVSRVQHYRQAARHFYSAGRRQDGRRCIRKALSDLPFAPKTWQLFILLELKDFLPAPIRQRLLHRARGH